LELSLRSNQEEMMIRQSAKGKGEGTFRELKGKIKESVGQLTNNLNLEAKGFGEKISGKMRNKIGDLESVVEIP
jgi:uncharacterized protein YjbJ (UPF0337 family)